MDTLPQSTVTIMQKGSAWDSHKLPKAPGCDSGGELKPRTSDFLFSVLPTGQHTYIYYHNFAYLCICNIQTKGFKLSFEAHDLVNKHNFSHSYGSRYHFVHSPGA